MKIIVLLLLFLPAGGVLGQASDPYAPYEGHLGPSKIHIFIDCTCNDIVGAQYATALRDAVARSPRYALASAASQGSGKDTTYNMTLSILSINDMANTPGVSTAISVVLEFEDVVFSQRIQVCGIEQISNCAATTLASADGDIQNLKR